MFSQEFINNQPEAMKFLLGHPWLVTLILAWAMVWKGFALWKAARLSHKWWFVIILLANTVGILEIIYLYFVARKYTVEEEDVDAIEAEENGAKN